MLKPVNWMLIGLMMVSGGLCWAQELDSASPAVIAPVAPAGRAKPLSISISKTLYLPPEMYGQWSVTGRLVESNTERFFNPVVHDVWVLERRGDEVVISNPANGASAAIEVDEVDGNTATFHRMVMNGSNKIYFEMPTISVTGDHLVGYTINKFQLVKDGKIKKSYYARYQLDAQRIGGSSVKFRNEEVEPALDVEEVRFR